MWARYARHACMVIINLMPWREWARKYQSRTMKQIILCTMIMVMLCFFCLHYGLTLLKTKLVIRVRDLQTEWQLLKENTIPQPDVSQIAESKLEAISTYRSGTENLFYQLSRGAIKGVCFSKIKRKDTRLFFYGKARSMNELTQFLDWCKQTQLLSDIKIDTLRRADSASWLLFALQGVQAYSLPVTEEDQNKNAL